MFVTLNNGEKIPHAGLGLFKMTREEMERVLPAYSQSTDLMYCDGAARYLNQEDFAAIMWGKMGIQRSKVFLADKLWDTEHGDVETGCRRTLRKLQVDYLDLYLVHWPISLKPSAEDPLVAEGELTGHPVRQDVPLEQVWAQMEALVRKGLVKSIGACNLTLPMLERILKTCSIKPAVLQIECHPWHQRDDLVNYCREHDIQVQAYSPLGTNLLLNDPLVVEIAKNHKASPAQVLLAFARQRNLLYLFKTGHPDRLRENLQEITLTEEDINKLRAMNKDKNLFHPSQWYGESFKNWP